MKKETVLVDKFYRLKHGKAPLSLTLNSRHSRRNPLLYFDGKSNRPLRYSSNQRTPFEDEQDGNVILEPIIFERGLLFVSRTNQVLQEFLSYHPGNNNLFEEVNSEREASVDVETLDYELEAQVMAKDLDIEMLETVCRVVLRMDTDKMTTAEMKRDVRVYAKRNPKDFLETMNDPMLVIQSKASKYIQQKLLALKNGNKDVYFNLPKNKKKILTVPYGENPVYILASFLQSDDGIEVMRLLDNKLD